MVLELAALSVTRKFAVPSFSLATRFATEMTVVAIFVSLPIVTNDQRGPAACYYAGLNGAWLFVAYSFLLHELPSIDLMSR
jgi:hypothetical protein